MVTQLSDIIQIPDAPAIPGLTWRHWRDETDFAPMAEIVNICFAAEGITERTTAASTANLYLHLPNSKPARDILLVEANGKLVGYVQTNWYDEDGQRQVCILRGFVLPEWQGKGIGRTLLTWAEGHQRAMASSRNYSGPQWFQIWTAAKATARIALAEKYGYKVVRYFYTMVCPLTDEMAAAEIPAGIEIRPVRPEHLPAIYEATFEAFRDHWGHTEPTEGMYQMWVEQPNFDPSLFVVAWDGAEVAGSAINLINEEENRANNYRRGWVDDLSVRRAWRKKGLGRALLIQSLHILKARGMTEAQLGVDVANPSGALGLYERVGFRPINTMLVYRKEMNKSVTGNDAGLSE